MEEKAREDSKSRDIVAAGLSHARGNICAARAANTGIGETGAILLDELLLQGINLNPSLIGAYLALFGSLK